MLFYSLATKLILDTCDWLKTVTQLEFHDVYMKVLPAAEGFYYYAQKFKLLFMGEKKSIKIAQILGQRRRVSL